MKFEDVKKTKFGLGFFVASLAMVLVSIIAIILAFVLRATWLMFVYLGLALVYAVAILVLEIIKGKNKEEAEEPAEEAAEEEKPAEEEAPAEEAVEEQPEEQPAEEEAPAEEPAEEPAQEEAPAEEEKPAEEAKPETPAPAAKPGKVVYVPFTERLRRSDPFVVYAYDEIKSELLSYGFKSRISAKGDSFRLHRKLYARITVAGKTLKIYMALNPRDYENTTIPYKDASDVKKYEDVPFVFKAKSDLSIRRAKQLIEDMAGNDNIEQKKVSKQRHTKEALKNAK